MSSTESRSVSWWPCYEFITALLGSVDDLPVAGTPRWCGLPDDDPRKLLSLAAAGVHHVLRMEVAQEARAEASRAVSAAADWSSVGRSRGRAYIERVKK